MKLVPYAPALATALSLVFLVSCEPPRLQEKEVVSAEPVAATTPDPSGPATGATTATVESPARPAIPAVAEPERAEEPPELFVEKTGQRIVLKGAVRSRIQQERIVETLRLEFPDAELEHDLKLEYHRVAVGWGNRIADELLVPYLRGVKDPRFSYKDNIITLEGTVAGQGELVRFTELVVNVISDGSAAELKNNLKVGTGPAR